MPLRGWSKGDPTSRPLHAGPSDRGGSSSVATPSTGADGRGPAGSPHCRPRVSKDPPSVRVAEVRTTVRGPNSFSRSRPPTPIGATRSAGGVAGPSPHGRVSQTTSRRSVSSGSKASSSRTAVSWSSSRPDTAIFLAALASASSRRFGPNADRQACAASRTAATAPPNAGGNANSSPGERSSKVSARPSPASASRSAMSSGISRPHRRTAVAISAAVSCTVATEVTRSTRSCASSTITTSCSGRTGASPIASIARRAWLVTTMSAREASARARSAKQSDPTGHFDMPRHSLAVTDTWRHACSGTPGTSSSRSPVSVSDDHSWSRRTCLLSADSSKASKSAVPSGSSGTSPWTRFRHR